jgi:hypothetical protein
MNDDQNENKDAAEKQEPDDPLIGEQNIRGPLIWAALIFVPIVVAMIMALMQGAPPPEAPATRERAPVETRSKTLEELGLSPRGDSAAPGNHSRPATMGGSPGVARTVAPPCIEGLWEGRAFNLNIKKQMVTMRRTYRLLPPGAVVTQDHNPARTNFELNENGIIKRTWCG